MTVMEAIEGRRSIRQYIDRPVEKDTMSNGHAVDTTNVCIALTICWKPGNSVWAPAGWRVTQSSLCAKPRKPVEEIAVYI